MDKLPPAVLSECNDLAALFRARVRLTPGALAYRDYDRCAGRWISTTWAEAGREVDRWRAALAAEGLAPGERVALQMRNSREWVFFEQAALGLGLVVVPLYLEDRPENTAYILAEAQVRLLLVQTGHHWQRLHPHAAQLGGLRRVLILDPEQHAAPAPALTVRSWLAAGDASAPAVRSNPPDALASIVFTSGTLGRPKGVMLSHRNILSNVVACTSLECFTTDDVFLSVLPLSHMFERTGGYYLPMMAGASVAFARSVQQLAEDLAAIRPTVLMAVPRLFERIYGRIQEQLAKGGGLRRGIFELAVATGWRRFQARQAGRTAPLADLAGLVLRPLVAAKVAQRLGGRLRFAISGGAALPKPVARLFIGLGIEVIQGYGLTEHSPVVSVNTPGDNDPASIGKPLPGVAVRLGEGDELLVRGPGVMLGYWRNEAATRAAIDAEGWLHTGDKARLIDGRLYITGRLKEILVMSNGEKVPPAEIEAAIALDPLFDNVLLLGEGQPYLAALVALNPEQWQRLAAELGLDPADPAALDDARLQRLLLTRIRDRLHDFPGHAKVRRVAPTLVAWTVENGLLTPTLKLRRHHVMARFAAQSARLFSRDEPLTS